jgi:hypothetical protein
MVKIVDRARELSTEIMKSISDYYNCDEALVCEAAQLLFDLADEVEYLKGRIVELDPPPY